MERERERTVARRLEVDEMRLEKLGSNSPINLEVLGEERGDVLTSSVRHEAVNEGESANVLSRQRRELRRGTKEARRTSNAPRLPQFRHVRINEWHARLALDPPHDRLLILELLRPRLILIPPVPPILLELRRSLLRIRNLLIPTKREQLGPELARRKEEVVPPQELKAEPVRRRGLAV